MPSITDLTLTHRLVMVGACYVDTILSVPRYPSEDEKLRASSLSRRRGGNCANSLEVLQQLNSSSCHLVLISVLPERASSASQFVASSFDDSVAQPEANVPADASSPPYSSVDLNHCIYRSQQTEPAASYIVKSMATGSRTIVNTNPLPEMQVDEFKRAVNDFVDLSGSSSPLADTKIATIPFTWFHFEGRNLPDTTMCASWLRQLSEQHGLASPVHGISVEVEKSGRPGLLDLATQADIIFYSRSWAEHEGYRDAAECVSAQADAISGARSKLLCCTWGAHGAVVRLPDRIAKGKDEYHDSQEEETTILRQQAFTDPEGKPVVDSIGAGDTFTAGMLHKLVMRNKGGASVGAGEASWKDATLVRDALEFAARLAGKKVMQEGFRGLA